MTTSFLSCPTNTQDAARPAPKVVNSKLRICTGSDCKKHRKRLDKVAAHVEDLCELSSVKCQEICKGPVVVLEHGKHVYWFKKMRGKKVRESLHSWLCTGEMPPRLEKRLVRRKKRREA